MAINNHNAASTGLSPFFFTHGYHVDPIALEENGLPQGPQNGPERAGEEFMNRFRNATEMAQAAVGLEDWAIFAHTCARPNGDRVRKRVVQSWLKGARTVGGELD
jgi:hypothetical protein